MSRRTAAIYSTLKEAYIKARRMGLPIPLNKFRFQQDSESPPPTYPLVLGLGMDDDVVAWSFAYFQSTSTFGGGMPRQPATPGASFNLQVQRIVLPPRWHALTL